MQAQPFWPDNLAEWTGMVTGLILFALTVGGILIKMGRDRQRSEDQLAALKAEMDRRFEDQGRRIGSSESHCSSHGASIEELRRIDIQHGLQLDTNTREVSRFGAQSDKLELTMQAHIKEAGTFEKKMRERLARIEERLRLPMQEG